MAVSDFATCWIYILSWRVIPQLQLIYSSLDLSHFSVTKVKLLLSSCSPVINTSRYGILDIQGVKLAIQTAASAKGQRPTQADKEKKDRAVAKTILDKLGMESEKYRLGYTKVLKQRSLSIHFINP